MTEMSGVSGNFDFDGSTVLVENNNKTYLFVSGFEFFKIATKDRIMDFMCYIGNNLIPYSIAI